MSCLPLTAYRVFTAYFIRTNGLIHAGVFNLNIGHQWRTEVAFQSLHLCKNRTLTILMGNFAAKRSLTIESSESSFLILLIPLLQPGHHSQHYQGLVTKEVPCI